MGADPLLVTGSSDPVSLELISGSHSPAWSVSELPDELSSAENPRPRVSSVLATELTMALDSVSLCSRAWLGRTEIEEVRLCSVGCGWERGPYLLGQDLCLQERVDGGQAAVLIAGPPCADAVPLVLDS